MMSLKEKERVVQALWNKPTTDLIGVLLEPKVLRLNVGYLWLTYEFEGWEEYVNEIKAREGKVF
jgi:hypothetical protein